MKIQYIGFNGNSFKNEDILTSNIYAPFDLDDFDLNVIDLNSTYIWNKITSVGFGVYYEQDLSIIFEMVKKSKEYSIIILPDNSKNDSGIKHFLGEISEFITNSINAPIHLNYGKTNTKVNNKNLCSDFVFDNEYYEALEAQSQYEGEGDRFDALTKSYQGKKFTSIRIDKKIVTTLNISNSKDLTEFLFEINIMQNNFDEIPEWMDEIKMFDDNKQFETIQLTKQRIIELQSKIEVAQQKINENKHVKSILYTQSDSLVEVVFEIIQELLDVDLAGFEDKKMEDISFSIDDSVFIGEIKGISDNIKSKNLSQLDNHYTSFMDKHPDISDKNIFKLLIINHQRKKPLDERDPVDQTQINLAENKYKSLIIETSELLKLLEKYREKAISRDEIINMFKMTGILKIKN